MLHLSLFPQLPGCLGRWYHLRSHSRHRKARDGLMERGSCLPLGMTPNLVELNQKLHSGEVESDPLVSGPQPALDLVGIKVKETVGKRVKLFQDTIFFNSSRLFFFFFPDLSDM